MRQQSRRAEVVLVGDRQNMGVSFHYGVCLSDDKASSRTCLTTRVIDFTVEQFRAQRYALFFGQALDVVTSAFAFVSP